jgi:hypothetical protein
MRERASRREWARLVSEWRRSGRRSKEFAAERGVNAGTLLWWSSKLRGERGGRRAARSRRGTSGRAVQLAELPIVELRGGVNDDRFELELSVGRRLRIPPGFDGAALERLLVVLK